MESIMLVLFMKQTFPLYQRLEKKQEQIQEQENLLQLVKEEYIISQIKHLNQKKDVGENIVNYHVEIKNQRDMKSKELFLLKHIKEEKI